MFLTLLQCKHSSISVININDKCYNFFHVRMRAISYARSHKRGAEKSGTNREDLIRPLNLNDSSRIRWRFCPFPNSCSRRAHLRSESTTYSSRSLSLWSPHTPRFNPLHCSLAFPTIPTSHIPSGMQLIWRTLKRSFIASVHYLSRKVLIDINILYNNLKVRNVNIRVTKDCKIQLVGKKY